MAGWGLFPMVTTTPPLRQVHLSELAELFSDDDLEVVYGGGKQFDIMKTP